METENPEALGAWIANWNDLVEFEVYPVISSARRLRKFHHVYERWRQRKSVDVSYFPGGMQTKLAASFVSPEPLYFAT